MFRKGSFIALLLFVCIGAASAQQTAYRVSFSDKNNTPYTLSNPIAYLSQRAIDRRTAQGVAIDSTDLPLLDAYVQGVLTASSGVLHTRSRWFNHIVILCNPANIGAVNALPYVTGTVQVGDYSTNLHNRESHNTGDIKDPKEEIKDPLFNTFAKSTGSAAYYGATWDQTTMVKGDCLHDQGFKGEGMLIAVLDDGFYYEPSHVGFDSLHIQNRIIDRHNFVLDTSYIYGSTSNHGGAVLSTMAGNVPGTYVGSAPNAEYALYITENLSSEKPIEMEQVLAATERADSLGADVVTISSGYNTFDNPYADLGINDLNGITTPAARAANMATKKGILFVATAGNDGSAGLLTPGDADSALTVGAVTPSGGAWTASGHGPNGAGQIKPDVVTLGAPANVFGVSGYSQGSGTSYSTPQMAGWAACLRQAKPNATPYDLRNAINKSANLYTTPEIQRGYGIPNFCVAADNLNILFVPKNMSDWASVAPNPFIGDIDLWTNLSLSDNVAYRLTDITGKTVLSNTQKVDSGIKKISIPVPANTPSGVYFLHVTSGSKEATIKIVKTN
jgi:serine protease AprX